MEKPKRDTRKYWIKLEKDFLNSRFIKIIKGMENGNDYILFYLALMLESVDTVGHLRLSNLVPYNEKMLSSLTDTNIDIVRTAMKLFSELGMLTILEDGTIFIPEVPRLTGKESESAERVRRHRLKQKEEALALQCNNDVTGCNDNKEEEEDKHKDKEKHTYKPREVLDLYNHVCTSLPKAVKLSAKRATLIRTLLKEFTFDEIKQGFEKAQASSFLKGGGNTGWKANLDWLINRNNLLKVIEGSYDKSGHVKEPAQKSLRDNQSEEYYANDIGW